MQNVIITDITLDRQWIYKLDEGSGLAILNTGKTQEIAGDTFDGAWTPNTNWVAIADNSRFYPMDDGVEGSGTLKDIIGGNDGTIVNYDPDAWSE